MIRSRVWLFRGLVAVVAGLMVTSFILPWWGFYIFEIGPEDVVRIYPYGLWLDLETIGVYAWHVEGAEMPVWFTPLMWIYLTASVGLLLYSTWLMGKRGKWLLGGVGLSYILVAVLAVIIAAIRTGDYFDVSLQGYTLISLGGWEQSGAEASLRFGYYVAHGVGLLCIVLALLRDKIIGKAKLDA